MSDGIVSEADTPGCASTLHPGLLGTFSSRNL
jgi:hypothetical protein